MRTAVVGSGTAGLTAACLLAGEHDVTVHEAGNRAGGDVRSLPVTVGRKEVRADSGAQHLSPTGFRAHRARYRQVLLTMDAVRARDELGERLGNARLQPAGGCLHGLDSQESAVRSALDAIGRIAADTTRTAALNNVPSDCAPERTV
ncbi:hypothetical protein FM076_18185 [Streptomyces albus subsp. chlorinus]|uniref:NAD(P)-binding protein n=1 Tax=Streptomyces albus TaxID=1888 RepID=UPI0015700F45|nr:NAD(P)-binding protein [Streptomyces albus]NSC22984.1 hypothetical protein [Streptomyces albus subsp. chlorinus]